MNALDRRFSIAPMMECTDRHERYFLRLLSRRTLLYTEMLSAAALIHGDHRRLLEFHPGEHPVALQVGGSDPGSMAWCASLGASAGYDEININVGCPSPRVSRGRFGASLMNEPASVAACVAAMRSTVSIPVTVKSRIGVDDRDSYEHLCEFIETIASAGCSTFVIHARKAWLAGLSPKENREVPPLRHDVVHRLKRDYAHLEIVINGGIDGIDAARRHLASVDGVMVGREAYRNPYMLAGVDREIFGEQAAPISRRGVVEKLIPYVDSQCARGTRLHTITRHVLGLYQGVPGARAWRRYLSLVAVERDANASTLEAALELVPGDA